MTVTANISRKTYSGNGSTTVFDTGTGFIFFSSSELVVKLRVAATGVETTKALGTDYTVSGGAGATGTVTMLTAPATGETLIVQRVMPLTQSVDLVNNADSDAEVMEDALDKLTLADQQNDEAVNRALRVSPAYSPSTFNTEVNPLTAGAYLRVNADVDGFEAVTGDLNTDSYTQSGTGAVERTVVAKLSDLISVRDFGAVGNDVADDTTGVTAADALGKTIYVPEGVYDTTIPANDLTGPFFGPGQIRDASNYKRGKYFTHISAAPSSFGTHGGIDQAFDGDISKVQFAVEHRISGAATLGQPTSGYTYNPEAAAFYEYMQNTSGYNHGTANANGRTLAALRQMRVYQAGQGDCAALSIIGYVEGTKAASTHFLANPAVTMCYGQFTAGTAGVYLNPYETLIEDGGVDCAGIGSVLNFNRSVSTGAKSAVWIGQRFQNIGTAYMDNVISGIGKYKAGIDFAMAGMDFDTTAAAISLRAGQRVYFNNTAIAAGNLEVDWRTTTFNNDYQYYGTNDSDTGIHTVVNNVHILSARTDSLTLKGINGLVFKSTGILRFEGSSQYGTGAQTATFVATNKPGSGTAGPTQWLSVVLGGTTHYIPCFPA